MVVSPLDTTSVNPLLTSQVNRVSQQPAHCLHVVSVATAAGR
jgi:hypothetical protein